MLQVFLVVLGLVLINYLVLGLGFLSHLDFVGFSALDGLNINKFAFFAIDGCYGELLLNVLQAAFGKFGRLTYGIAQNLFAGVSGPT